MITEPAAQWALTAVFAAAGLTAALPRRDQAGVAQPNTGMPAAGAARGAMAPMSRAVTPAPVLVISILLAVSCAAASIPWLARAFAPGHRVQDPAAVSQAAMSAGMAAMLLATL